MSGNYKYFVKTDTSRFSGQWIALTDKKVIAHGQDAQKVYDRTKKIAGKKDISLAKAAKTVLVSADKKLVAKVGDKKLVIGLKEYAAAGSY